MAITQLRLGPADHGRSLTLDDFETAEYVPGFHYEIIDGEVYVSPLPNLPENILETWLRRHLEDYADDNPHVLNFVTVKARVPIPARPRATVPEPDIACYAGVDFTRPVRELSWKTLSPRLIVEVLVDSDPAKDLQRNPGLYLLVPSIEEYWVIDGRNNPDEPALLQHQRHGNGWRITSHAFGTTFTTKLLPGFALVVNPRA